MEINEIFSRNLRRIMDEKRYRAVDLVEGLGVSKQIVSAWMNGHRVPRIRMIDRIAAFLGCSREDLLGQSESNTPQLTLTTGLIKVYDGIPAGVPAFLDDQIVGYLPTLLPHPTDYVAIKVHGNSMTGAGINDGCTVVIKKQDCAENGQIVACRVNGDDVTLKRFSQQGDNVILSPANPEYSPIIVPACDFENGSAQILGVLKQVIIEY